MGQNLPDLHVKPWSFYKYNAQFDYGEYLEHFLFKYEYLYIYLFIGEYHRLAVHRYDMYYQKCQTLNL